MEPTTTRRDVSLSFIQANLYGLVMPLPPIVLLVWLYIQRWGLGSLAGGSLRMVMTPTDALVAIGLIMVGLVAHEALHGLTWAYFVKSFKVVKFGLDWKTLTPYCHIKDPLPVNAYRLGGLMPGLVLGFVPALAGWLTGQVGVFAFGLLFILGAGGDLLILWLLRQVKPNAWVEDHPQRVGCVVIETP
jgi:hypothetical protein